MNNYTLRIHHFFTERLSKLADNVKRLSKLLSQEQLVQHESVKLLGKIKRAIFKIVPQDPNLREYCLRGSLSKFRRYKRGLQRYRIICCFSNYPPIIVYLYML